MRVLTYGDNPKVSTGYGCAWDNFLALMKKERPDWEIYHAGWQNKDRPHETKEGYWMLPMDKVEYGYDTVANYLKQYNPDFLITMADFGVQTGFIDGVVAAKQNGWRGKWIQWLPIDTHHWEFSFWDKTMEFGDIKLCMADFGVLQFTKHGQKDLKNIPLGVDTKKFYPLANRNEIRTKYGLNDKFVIGFVGKNQRRKMIATLMKGYAKFAKGKADVKLLLHTDKIPAGGGHMGWSLDSLQAKMEGEIDPDFVKLKKAIMTKNNMGNDIRQKIQPETMNEIYNLMDVFLYATGGEGFGIPGIECQAAGVPLMMSDNSTGPELTGYGDHGWLIPMLKDQYGRVCGEIGTNGVENYFPDDFKIAEMLEIIYQDWKNGGERLKFEREKARQFSLKYDWTILTNKLIKLLEDEI